MALATRELNTLDAQIAPEEAQVSAAQYTLAVLLGEYPESIVNELKTPDLIPTMPGVAAPGVPLDLLKRRPDIQQAERELAATTARIGVATAELFPQIALVGSLGSQQGQASGSTQTLGKHIWSFGPGAVWPLLDFGAIDAEVDIADLEARASLLNYRKTILNAVREVDARSIPTRRSKCVCGIWAWRCSRGSVRSNWPRNATTEGSRTSSTSSMPSASTTTFKSSTCRPRSLKASNSCSFTRASGAGGRTISKFRTSGNPSRP